VTQAILPRVIGAIGTRDFAAVTARALCEFLDFELTAVFLHRSHGEPAVVFENFGARDGIQNYVHFTHKINPMLARPAGVYRARDFALRTRDAVAQVVLTPEEELGFRTVGWPQRQEEICLYVEACAGLVELGFYRERGRTMAPANKVRALQAMSAPIAAAFDRHQALTRTAPAALSSREREVYSLLLLGCSSTAIAYRLNISRHTVKDHRKHIFRKLRVATLAELFALRESTRG